MWARICVPVPTSGKGQNLCECLVCHQSTFCPYEKAMEFPSRIPPSHILNWVTCFSLLYSVNRDFLDEIRSVSYSNCGCSCFVADAKPSIRFMISVNDDFRNSFFLCRCTPFLVSGRAAL